MTDKIVIRAEGLTKQFGDFVATDHVSFEVHEGEIFGFLGANGAGKTTAMRMLCGLSQPSDGKATVAGFDVAKEHGVQNEDLKAKLLATGDEHLEEGNTWGDRIWGTVNGKGQNHLGKTLMRVREELKETK